MEKCGVCLIYVSTIHHVRNAALDTTMAVMCHVLCALLKFATSILLIFNHSITLTIIIIPVIIMIIIKCLFQMQILSQVHNMAVHNKS